MLIEISEIMVLYCLIERTCHLDIRNRSFSETNADGQTDKTDSMPPMHSPMGFQTAARPLVVRGLIPEA